MKSSWIWVLLLIAASGRVQAGEELRFNRDVRSILAEKCFQCHGPDKGSRFAELRLDQREVAVGRGVIVPGDPEASKLYMRINAESTAVRMPPAFSNKNLSDAERQTLVRWIREGAKYESHWAYLKPEQVEAPAGPAGVDALVNRRLAERNLQAVGEAGRRTLIRRLSFDLTGLPPEPARVNAFVNDRDPRAYRKLVDELLGSPRFGERMAVWWLDLVRYADSVGYHSDVPVSVSPYRDYVINAFNANKPFDEFTREQIAGDLLPGATLQQQVASAYNRLARMTNEGGAQAQEYLVKYAADRVRTTSTTWLGSTLGCAECHDHKFDPFRAKDFYQMSAFFADLEEEGVYGGNARFGPTVRVPRPDDKAEWRELETKLARLKNEALGDVDAAGFVAYWKTVEKSWSPAAVRSVESMEGLEFRRLDDGSFEAFGEEPKEDFHQLEIEIGAEPVSALMVEVLPKLGGELQTEEWKEDGFHISKLSAWWIGRDDSLRRLRVRTALPDRESAPDNLARHTQDDNDDSGWGEVKKDSTGTRRPALRSDESVPDNLASHTRGDNADSGWGETEKDSTEARRIALLFEEPVRDGKLWLQLKYNGRRARTVAGRYKVFVTAAEFVEIPLQGELSTRVQTVTGGNANWQQARRLERRQRELMDAGADCVVAHSIERRPVRILARGNWMDESGEVVQPQSIGFLGEIPSNGRELTRLDLANWLVDENNPLTARVFVNRLWKMYFGTGISKTLDDLGSQGEPPVNQDLLDWLAVEFMESGWDMKHIVRTLVLTDAYRRSSEATEELKAADPYNRLHGRQSVLRIDAEFVRDNALAVSGLLNPAIGGPSAKPYQPAGYYQELNFPKRTYQVDLDENQYRRGLYTHWQRTFLHPSLMAFDAPSREECTAERSVSNTPLQSLTLLNDPTYVEAARALAERLIESGDETGARIRFAFQQAFSRDAVEDEVTVLSKFQAQQLKRFQSAPEDARRLAKAGQRPVPENLDQAELAAWTAVARALLNKHEFIMRY